MGLKVDEVLRSIEREAWGSFFPIIGPEKGKILVDIIREIKPKRILEVGTLVGYSTLIMGRELDSEAEIITLEIDGDEAESAEENIRNAEVQPTVKVIVGDALELIPHLEGVFDMVFLDAEKSEYLDYAKLIEGRLHTGSVIVADNTDISTGAMRKYLAYMRHSGRYISHVRKVKRGAMEVSVKV